MAMVSADSRPYELVLLGATGYTGKLTAEYIQEHVATDLKWAIAGRNREGLAEIAKELKALNPDRTQPGIVERPKCIRTGIPLIAVSN